MNGHIFKTMTKPHTGFPKAHEDTEGTADTDLVSESAEDKHETRRAKKMANKLHAKLVKGID